MTKFGMCSLANGKDLRSKIDQLITMVLALAILIQLDLFSVCYVVQHLREDDVESSTFALMQVIAIFSTIASFVSLIYHRSSVCRYFDRIQLIVEHCKLAKKAQIKIDAFFQIFLKILDKSSSSAVIYAQVNQFCETFMIWATLFMVASYLVSSLMPVIGGMLFYYFKDGYVETSNLYLPLKLK